MIYGRIVLIIILKLNHNLIRSIQIIVVSNPRNYHLCQHCLHDPEWAEFIQVNRIKNHFIFTIESTGAMRPDVLFEEAIHVLKKKCELTIEGLDLIE